MLRNHMSQKANKAVIFSKVNVTDRGLLPSSMLSLRWSSGLSLCIDEVEMNRKGRASFFKSLHSSGSFHYREASSRMDSNQDHCTL
jgi:hypothetical protein